MIIKQSEQIMREVGKVLMGKQAVIEKVLMAIYAGGHILLEDTPGVGKTTLALGFSRVLGLDYRRIQFTPDTMPSDITGYTIPGQGDGGVIYRPGAVNTNLFLGDEINRTSPKTQSALLEAMAEGNVTVDGVTHLLPKPFICIATQNPVGMAGTQPLPEAQLDRFMICVKMGYPTVTEEVDILKRNQFGRADSRAERVFSADGLLEAQERVSDIFVHDVIYTYIARLSKATREQEMIALGLSPRGTIALTSMAKACAYLNGREYVIPDDVKAVFPAVAAHRIQLSTKARVGHILADDLIQQILDHTAAPALSKK